MNAKRWWVYLSWGVGLAASAAWAADGQPPTQSGAGPINATQHPEASENAPSRTEDTQTAQDDATTQGMTSTGRGPGETPTGRGADATTRGMRDAQPLGYTGRYSGVRASKLIGSHVVNPEGADLGKIEDVAVDPATGRVAYAVLSFGGFLGIGDKYFAIPWKSLQFDPGDDEKISLAVDKSQLESARGFDKDQWPDMANETWARTTHTSFGAEPYWESLTGDQRVQPKRIVRLSEVTGDNVKNNQDEQLGTIDEVIVDSGQGRIAYAVIGTGGFLDIGEELIAVPWEKLSLEDKNVVRLAVDKDALLAGPKFNKAHWPEPHNDAYLIEVYRHYNAAPYWTVATSDSTRISDARGDAGNRDPTANRKHRDADGTNAHDSDHNKRAEAERENPRTDSPER